MRGETWWASHPEQRRSEAGFWQPAPVAQANSFDRIRIQTAVAAITSNEALAYAPENVPKTKRSAGLPAVRS
jgi:hypothetical protein